jgi:hypothetical protein
MPITCTSPLLGIVKPSQLTSDISQDPWKAAFPAEAVGAAMVKTASRLIPRSVFQDDDLRQRTYAAHRDGVDNVCFHLSLLLCTQG